jgi:hypothetical protein
MLALKKTAAILPFVLALAACAASTRVETLYRSPASGAAPFGKVLVVGVHENAALRQRFENAVVTALGGGTQAVASVTLTDAERALDRDMVVAAAQSSGSDAVLVTRLLDVKYRADVEQGAGVSQARRRDDAPIADFFRYDYVTYQDPMTVTTVADVLLGTDLYSVATEAKVWSAESTAFEKNNVNDVIASVSGELAERLRAEGLVRR